MMVSSDFMHEGLGKPLKKPYSIATTNRELQDEGTIGFVVKKSREGFMSEYLTQGIKLGDVLHLQ
jgi:ferredoxin-NADP reductase